MATDTTPVTSVVTETLENLTETPASSRELTKTLTITTATTAVVLAGFYVHSKLAPKVRARIAELRANDEVDEAIVADAKKTPHPKKTA